jgi:RNA polymerase sigma-70 factor (ECF subfamily)
MKAYVKKRISNEQDAEDILQSIFLKIHNNIDKLSDVSKLSSWIYTIARNTINDFYRVKNNDVYIENLPEHIFIEQQNEETLNKEMGNCLIHMIQDLPDIYKQALILIEFENYTQKELAKQLGLSVSGAKSRVQRARYKLKGMLLNCCSIEQDHRGNVIDYKQKDNRCNYC